MLAKDHTYAEVELECVWWSGWMDAYLTNLLEDDGGQPTLGEEFHGRLPVNLA